MPAPVAVPPAAEVQAVQAQQERPAGPDVRRLLAELQQVMQVLQAEGGAKCELVPPRCALRSSTVCTVFPEVPASLAA